MLFPKNRMKFRRDHGGKTTPEGFLMLDISAVDLDGVRTIVVSVEDIEAIRAGGDKASDRLSDAKKLLGGD